MDYVVDQVVGKLIEVVKKKNKAGVSVKPFQVRDALYIVYDAYICIIYAELLNISSDVDCFCYVFNR